MKTTINHIQNAASDQAEMLLNLLRINLDGNQQMLEFNATMVKRNLNLLAKHSKALTTNHQLAQNPVWLAEMAQDLNQACCDYLLGSKTLITALQSHINSLIEAEAKKFGDALIQSVAVAKPDPAGQELIDTTVRSWTGITQKSLEQAQEWQKQFGASVENGNPLLAALSAQAARQNGANTKRRSAEARAA
jgi:hypothetical protein